MFVKLLRFRDQLTMLDLMTSLALLLRLFSLHIFSSSLSQSCFPDSRKKAASFPIFKKGNNPSVSNYGPQSLLITFSKLFQFFHSWLCFTLTEVWIKYFQRRLTKSKSAISNLVTYLHILTPLFGYQRQSDAIYFDFSSVFDLIPHTVLLHKFNGFGFSGLCDIASQLPSQLIISGPCF
jgi:hypothetical protein